MFCLKAHSTHPETGIDTGKIRLPGGCMTFHIWQDRM